MNKLSYKVYVALTITIILWSSAFVGIRFSLTDYSPGSLALLRYGVASIGMVFLYLRVRHRHKIALKDILPLVLSGVLGFTVYNIALNYGEISVSAGIAGFIIGLSPLFTMILAIIFLKEKVTWLGWLGVAISFIGICLIAIGQHGGVAFDYGVLYTLVATLSTSIYIILQKPLLSKFHPIELTAFAIWIGTAAMLFYLPQLIHQISMANWQTTLTVVYLGIFPAAIAFALWTYALSFMSASMAARYLYAMPVVTTIMGWLLINEIPATLSLIGGIVSLAGAIIANQTYFKTKRNCSSA